MLNEDGVLVIPFLSASMPDSPEGNVSIVRCFLLMNLKSKVVMLD